MISPTARLGRAAVATSAILCAVIVGGAALAAEPGNRPGSSHGRGGAAAVPPGVDAGSKPPSAEAAVRYGWGTPISAGSDEFNYVGAPKSAKWYQAGECWPANDTVKEGRCASRSTVDGSKLVMTGRSDGKAP